MSAEVTVVLVTFNSRGVLPASLRPLAALPHVVVVDNGSSDGTPAAARELLPQARVIEVGRNLGFGRANNLALEQVTTPFALLLNPDCTLAPADIDALVAAAQRYPQAAILAPKLYDRPGQLGLCYRPAFFRPQPAALLEPAGDLCTEFLTGACMLLRMEALRGTGFFDPWFFLYLEDDDLCERVRRAGHSLVLVNDAGALHGVRKSSAPSARLDFLRPYCLTLSKLYLTRKYFGGPRALRAGVGIFLGSLLALPVHLLSFNRGRLLRTLARIAAAAAAPFRLRARHCLG